MLALAKKFWKSDRGLAAIEFAFIAPVLVVLGAGTLEFGLWFQAYDSTNRLASQFAISWSDCSDFPAGICLTEASNYTSTNSIHNLAPRLITANVAVRMFQVTYDGTTLSTTYAVPTNATMSTAEQTAAKTKLVAGDVGVVVTVTYTHSLAFFSSLMTPYLGNLLSMTARAVQLK